MEFRDGQAIEILRTTPQVLRASLTDVSDPWVNNNYGEKTFSPFAVVLCSQASRVKFQSSRRCTVVFRPRIGLADRSAAEYSILSCEEASTRPIQPKAGPV